jgi:hypothetical protein
VKISFWFGILSITRSKSRFDIQTKHKIFDPRVFFIKLSPLRPDSRANAVLNMASNLPIKSRKSFEMIGFHGLNVTTKAASAVSVTPRKRIPWFQWDCGSGFSGIYVTMEAASAVAMRPRNPYKNNFLSFVYIFVKY